MNIIVQVFLTKNCMQGGKKEANCGTLWWRWRGNDNMYMWEDESCINFSFHDLSLIRVTNMLAVTITASQRRLLYTAFPPLSLAQGTPYDQRSKLAQQSQRLYIIGITQRNQCGFHTLSVKNPSLIKKKKKITNHPTQAPMWWQCQFWFGGFLLICVFPI